MTRNDVITAIEIAASDDVEAYLRDLPFDPGTPDVVRTLIAGNVRGFYRWLMTPPGAMALARAVRTTGANPGD